MAHNIVQCSNDGSDLGFFYYCCILMGTVAHPQPVRDPASSMTSWPTLQLYGAVHYVALLQPAHQSQESVAFPSFL